MATLHKAQEAKKQLGDIIGNLEEDVRNSIYEAHSELERFVPRRMFKSHEEHREFEGRGKQKEQRQDWPGVREVIDIDLSGPQYDALKLRLKYVEKAARRLAERIKSEETDQFKQRDIETVFARTRDERQQNSTTISGDGFGYIQDYEAADRFKQADDKVREFVREKKPITLERIIELNTMLRGEDKKRPLGLRDDSYPAATTNEGSFLSGAEVDDASKDMLDWYHKNKGQIPAIELAVKMRRKMISIHLASDGNGRVADSVMNWVLQEHGMPPVYFDERKNLSGVFASKQIIVHTGEPVDLSTLVDASTSQSNGFSLSKEENAKLFQMRQQKSMARIETLCTQVERQLEKLSQIMGPDPQWEKNNSELISTIRSLLEQRKATTSQKSQIESGSVSHYHSQEQLKELLKRGMQGTKGLLSAKDADGGEINGVIDFDRSNEQIITITNEMGTRQIALNDISFTKSDRVDVRHITVKDTRLSDQQIPQVFAQSNKVKEQQSQIDHQLQQLTEPLSAAEFQQLTEIFPDLNGMVRQKDHSSMRDRHLPGGVDLFAEEQSTIPLRQAVQDRDDQATNVNTDQQPLRLMLKQRFEEKNKRQKVLGSVGLSRAHDVSDQQINETIDVMRAKLNLSGDEIKTILNNFKTGPIEWKGECSDPSLLMGTKRISTGNTENNGALFKRDRGLIYVSQATIDEHLKIDERSNKVTGRKNEPGRKSSSCGIFKKR